MKLQLLATHGLERGGGHHHHPESGWLPFTVGKNPNVAAANLFFVYISFTFYRRQPVLRFYKLPVHCGPRLLFFLVRFCT